MKVILTLLVILVFSTGCVSGERTSQSTPGSQPEIAQKTEPPSAFFNEDIVPLKTSSSSSPEIMGWYDEKMVFYLEEEQHMSTLSLYNFKDGSSSPFLTMDGWILSVEGNKDFTIFAIQTLTEDDKTTVSFVNREAETLLELEDFGEDFTFYWNPYQTEELIVLSFLPNWEYDVLLIDVYEKKVKPLPIQQTFFQWKDKDTLAYLEWDDTEPDYQAPLRLYNIEANDSTVWGNDVIAVMNLGEEHLLTVNVDSIHDMNTKYQFMDSDMNIVSQLEVPILNTYSEQWWIPFHAISTQNNTFYYLRPKYSGDFFSYKDGYELKAYNIKTGTETSIVEMENHVPMLLSPGSDYMLLGSGYRELLDIESKELYPLLEN